MDTLAVPRTCECLTVRLGNLLCGLGISSGSSRWAGKSARHASCASYRAWPAACSSGVRFRKGGILEKAGTSQWVRLSRKAKFNPLLYSEEQLTRLYFSALSCRSRRERTRDMPWSPVSAPYNSCINANKSFVVKCQFRTFNNESKIPATKVSLHFWLTHGRISSQPWRRLHMSARMQKWLRNRPPPCRQVQLEGESQPIQWRENKNYENPISATSSLAEGREGFRDRINVPFQPWRGKERMEEGRDLCGSRYVAWRRSCRLPPAEP